MTSVAFKHRRTGETMLSAEYACAQGHERSNDCADMTTEWRRDCPLAAGYAGPAASARRFLGLVACLIFAMSLPVFADCDTELHRAEKYDYQLAVCQKSEWRIYKHSLTSTPYHHLAVSPDKVEFFWAVPASEQHEFIYASTLYKHPDEQRLSIFRSSTYKTPRLFRVLAPFNDVYKVFPDDPKSIRQSFVDYHGDRKSLSEDDPAFDLLSKWHDTEIWGRLRSYDLVSTSLALRKERPEDPPLVAAERLIRLAENRPKTSWIKFDSHVEAGQPLRITLAYSGYKDKTSGEPKEQRIWPFNFKVSWNVQIADENKQ